MEINNVNASAAYTNASASTPPVENSQLSEQNIEASRAQLDSQTASAAQQAFEVNITQEARNLQTQNRQDQELQQARQDTETRAAQTQYQNSSVPINQASQIVNIVA